MLYECKDDYVLLSKDLSQLENFISLNELQIENRGKVNYSFIGNDMNYVIAPLILIVDSLAKGIGLDNVRKRLELIYGANYELKCEADNDVFEVSLSINLQRKTI